MKRCSDQIVEHGGGLPGWLTLISRAPEDGLGVAVFTNWDEGDLVMDLIKYYLYEKALGLPHVDWSSRCVIKIYRINCLTTNYPACGRQLEALGDAGASATDRPRPGLADFAPSFTSKFAGTYINLAYGRYDICLPPPHSQSSFARCSKSDKYWELVRRSNVSEESVEPSLGVVLPAVDANYAQLYPISNTAFSVTGFSITTTPSTSGGEQRPVVALAFGYETMVEFAIGKDGNIEGFGFKGIWGAGYGVKSPTGKTVKERAEVWFDRINE